MIPSSDRYTNSPIDTCPSDSKKNTPSTTHQSASTVTLEPTYTRQRELTTYDIQKHPVTGSPKNPKSSLLIETEHAIKNKNTDQLKTLTLLSCQSGDLACLEKILLYDAITVFHKNKDGRTALHLATLSITSCNIKRTSFLYSIDHWDFT